MCDGSMQALWNTCTHNEYCEPLCEPFQAV